MHYQISSCISVHHHASAWLVIDDRLFIDYWLIIDGTSAVEFMDPNYYHWFSQPKPFSTRPKTIKILSHMWFKSIRNPKLLEQIFQSFYVHINKNINQRTYLGLSYLVIKMYFSKPSTHKWVKTASNSKCEYFLTYTEYLGFLVQIPTKKNFPHFISNPLILSYFLGNFWENSSRKLWF